MGAILASLGRDKHNVSEGRPFLQYQFFELALITRQKTEITSRFYGRDRIAPQGFAEPKES
jgi:hypothetical protein